ncbi:MAG: ectonucleotide pyrophosphatase phosphodiesterase [Candelina mexicana]|nr:MAG: ectonucleotide pyrophosphatase phosphodiesterase [Candelina mexicana]
MTDLDKPTRANSLPSEASAHSLTAEDLDSEDDDFVQGASSSFEIAEYDQTVLQEEDEREKLLIGGTAGDGLRRVFGGHDDSSKARIGRLQHRREQKQKGAAMKEKHRMERSKLLAGKGQNGELMYEMEERGLRSDRSSESSEYFSDLDRRKFDDTIGNKSRVSRLNLSLIFTMIILLFLMLLFGAFKASWKVDPAKDIKLLSNGTSSFAPTTILISLDGFRADFLNRGLTPTLNSFVANGVSPKYMLPSFPSLTFPNHFTLATGLYPESHGIVGNTFWDPEMGKEFYYTDPARSMQPEWWGGEPLWVTAENSGIRSAIHMWPGSEAHIGGVEPAYLDKYNGTEILSRKVSRVLEFLDYSESTPRPQFIAFYVPNVDQDGHLWGPNSTQIRATIKNVDDMLASLFDGLEHRNLTQIVNTIVVSDHGMATTSTDRLIQLDDLIDISLVEHIDGWPLYGLRPKDPADLQGLYDRLAAKAKSNPNFDVYLRDKNMPARYHFSNNVRIAPLWIVPKTGWAIVTKEEFDVKSQKEQGAVYHPRGLHGYDNANQFMQAIFVARGPAFPHKPNSRVEVFRKFSALATSHPDEEDHNCLLFGIENTEVYNIVCDSLHMTPKLNNGTLRLPLKPVGLHSDADSPTEDIPIDFPSTNGEDASPISGGSNIVVDEPQPEPTRPVVTGDGGSKEEQKAEKEIALWWASLVGKLQAAKQWAEDLFASSSENDDD